MEEEDSDSLFRDALSDLGEEISTSNSFSTQENVIYMTSKGIIVNSKERRGSFLHPNNMESDDSSFMENVSTSFRKLHNPIPHEEVVEQEIEREPGETITSKGSTRAKPGSDSESVSGVSIITVNRQELKGSGEDTRNPIDTIASKTGVLLDSTSSVPELVMGTIKFPGENKWGDAKPKSLQSLRQQKSPRSSFNLEEQTITSITSSSSSTAAKATTATTEQSYDNEPDAFTVRAAADCLHAQDFTKMVEVLDSAPMTAAVMFGRGLAYYRLHKYPEAIQNFTEMDHLVAQFPLSQHSSVYLAHYYLGEIELACKKFKKAAKHYGKAAKSHSNETVAKRYRMVQPSLASVYSKEGSSLRQAQLIMEAVQAYKSAIAHATNRKDRLAAHTSLGNLYQSLGENKSALEQYEATVCLADELGDHISLGWAYGNMGNAYLGLYEKDKALTFLKKSLELTIEYEPTPQAIGRAYNNLGTAYQSMNKLDEAEEYYSMALNQAIYGMDEAGEARVRGNYGNLLMLQKKYNSAIVHYTETLAITKDRSTKCTAYHNRGCAHYEKTETEKKKFLGWDASKKDNEFYVTFTGPSMMNEQRDPLLPTSLKSGYRKGQDDLSLVVQYHEETFQTMRGSPQGLNLSVSLFETNSRSFHRLQDCLYNQQEWEKALEYAEQSRARTLGELLFDRKYGQLPLQLISPLRMEQIQKIIELVGEIVVYVSYTGARLLTWVFAPCGDGKVVTNMFQVAVEDDQFDGNSLDYFLRYLLAEVLNEKETDMYTPCTYEKSPALNKLYHLFARPLLATLENVSDRKGSHASIKNVIVIPDSYTTLMPMFALFNDDSDSKFNHQFLGDKFCFRIMPSLLTLGILSQLPPAVVYVPLDSQDFCVVGNPSIPNFTYQGETWNLGKLPYATQEAESVAHILKCSPTLHEEATKNVVVSMISKAKVVHLATHGSAVAGFLAFAGLGFSRIGAVANDKNVLLYPEEVEKLNINPALVVLSSCDSGRGMVKADGIQGMARAFILAGAQAVLTTLWRVPDESAAVFMQFFYQYMMDGFKASHALQKAMLSIRSFQRYSKYIHWSGYQLTGRELEFYVNKEEAKIGPCPVFPRLDVVSSLEKVLIKNRYLPTDVQVIHGPHGLSPAEPVLQFVASNYTHFPGGVFYVSAHNEHILHGAEQIITEELSKGSLTKDKESHVLLIFDGLLDLPPPSSFLHTLIQKNNTHIIFIIEEKLYSPANLKRQIDTTLLRGTNEIKLLPLSELHVTRRLVHGIMTKCEFSPYNKEQDILATMAAKSLGSSDLANVISALLSKYIDEDEEENGFLEKFNSEICSVVCSRSCSVDYSSSCSVESCNSDKDAEEMKEEKEIEGFKGMTIKEKEWEKVTNLKEGEKTEGEGKINVRTFDGDFVSQLIDSFHLSRTDFVMLSTLSLFGAAPIPLFLIEQIQLLVQEASSDPPGRQSPLKTLLSSNLLNYYPSPVISQPRSPLSSPVALTESSFYCMPHVISEAVYEHLNPEDLVFSLSTADHSLEYAGHARIRGRSLALFLAGLAQIVLEKAKNHVVIYKKIYRTYLLLID